MKDREWYPISDRVRILCIVGYNQDAILLVDIAGSLVLNLNDASDNGWGNIVKRIFRKYKVSFNLQLAGFGDADVMNIWREDGHSSSLEQPEEGRWAN